MPLIRLQQSGELYLHDGVWKVRWCQEAIDAAGTFVNRRWFEPAVVSPATGPNGVTQEEAQRIARRLLMIMLASVPVALVVAVILGYALVRRALSPLEHMTLGACEITVERLGERFASDGANDELGRLARALNDSLARIESAFEQLHRFTSDCSHELRAPLAMIRSVGEAGLQKALAPVNTGSVLEACWRRSSLTLLVDSLLLISRTDARNLPLQRIAVRVMAVAREAASLFEVLIEEKSLRLVLDGDERVEVEADPPILKQALVNIIHNAVKYSPDGETVVVRVLNQGASQVTVEVEDHGPGIPPDEEVKVFERFYRGSRTRERNSSGAGLGLAIAKWAVEANGGSIGLVSSYGRGCTVGMHSSDHFASYPGQINWIQFGPVGPRRSTTPGSVPQTNLLRAPGQCQRRISRDTIR